MKKILLLTLSALLLISFSSCKGGKDKPQNEETSGANTLTLSGGITTDIDMEAEGLTILTALSPEMSKENGGVTKPREIVGECRVEGKKFTITLKKPKHLVRVSENADKDDKWSNPDVYGTYIALGFFKEDDRADHIVQCVQNFNKEYKDMTGIEFMYFSDDVTFIKEKENINLKFKKGWNFVAENENGTYLLSRLPTNLSWILDYIGPENDDAGN